MEFTQALADHLKMITARDLDGYLDTVHDDATVILPTGALLTGKTEIARFHASWFEDADWSMWTDTIRAESFGDSALAILSVDYHDLGPKRRPYQRTYYLSLSFVHVGGRWLLVHEQNTFA